MLYILIYAKYQQSSLMLEILTYMGWYCIVVLMGISMMNDVFQPLDITGNFSAHFLFDFLFLIDL